MPLSFRCRLRHAIRSSFTLRIANGNSFQAIELIRQTPAIPPEGRGIFSFSDAVDRATALIYLKRMGSNQWRERRHNQERRRASANSP